MSQTTTASSPQERCPQCGKAIIKPVSHRITQRQFDRVRSRTVVITTPMTFCSEPCGQHYQMSLEG